MNGTTWGRPTSVGRLTSPMLPRAWSLLRWTLRRGRRRRPCRPRVHFTGTHAGEFQGLPPTHKTVSFSGLELNRFVEGRASEHWFQMDALSLLQQLGLVVVPGPRLLPRLLAHRLKKLRKKR
jgi:hypothetical protein